MLSIILIILSLQVSQPQRVNVLHQCAHPENRSITECVFKVKDNFYFCGGDFGILNECIINLQKRYDMLRFNYVPYTLLWEPNMNIEYSQFPTQINTPKYFQPIQ